MPRSWLYSVRLYTQSSTTSIANTFMSSDSPLKENDVMRLSMSKVVWRLK